MTIALQPLELPLIHGRPTQEFLTDAGKSLLGLLRDNELHVFRYTDGFAPVCRFTLPKGFEGHLALALGAARLVGVTSDGIWQIEGGERGGRHRQGYVFEDADAAEVKAAQFSASGKILWVGRERWQNKTPQNDPLNAWHELSAFDGETLTLLGRVPITGEADGAHHIRCHPLHDIVGVGVSCGQDGSWLSFAQIVQGRLERRAELVARPNDPFAFPGFAPDGSALMIVDQSAACEFSWPGADIAAQVTAEAENAEDVEYPALFGWAGAYLSGHFVASVYQEAEDKHLLRAFACPGLRVPSDLRLEGAANQEVWRLDRLGEDVLLASYKQRLLAWRIVNHSSLQDALPL